MPDPRLDKRMLCDPSRHTATTHRSEEVCNYLGPADYASNKSYAKQSVLPSNVGTKAADRRGLWAGPDGLETHLRKSLGVIFQFCQSTYTARSALAPSLSSASPNKRLVTPPPLPPSVLDLDHVPNM